ncbi:MAG TPA: glycine zipper 2TM domain-containing protein [Casimicrobiaceae bacterium]
MRNRMAVPAMVACGLCVALAAGSGETLAQQPPQNVIPAPSMAPPPPPPRPPSCGDCGVVQSIRYIEEKGGSSGGGAVIGGVLGGVLGHQIGSGRGNTAATIAGAAGGALVGNEVERNRNSKAYWEVRVAMDGGNTRTFQYSAQPYAREGDRVRLINGGRSLEVMRK